MVKKIEEQKKQDVIVLTETKNLITLVGTDNYEEIKSQPLKNFEIADDNSSNGSTNESITSLKGTYYEKEKAFMILIKKM